MTAAAPSQARMDDALRPAGGAGAAMGEDELNGRKNRGEGRWNPGNMPDLCKKMYAARCVLT